MKIAFVGSGYVGLVSGTVLASLGHQVVCIDKDAARIEQLKKGNSPLYETGLDSLIQKVIAAGNLDFSHDLSKGIIGKDAIFIAVNTPSAEDGSADLSDVYKAIDELAGIIAPNQVIVIKSTVPPGTVCKIQEYLHKKGLENSVVSNPEFLREGSAIYDFLNPDRIVVGTVSHEARSILLDIYKPLIDKGVKCITTDSKTAELIKYASNSFLAVKIAFINEMANICEGIGANIMDLAYGLGLDSRIGGKHLQAGPGFGGSCFPKDILAISHLSKHLNEPCTIIEAVISSNDKRKYLMTEKVVMALRGESNNEAIGDDISDKTICALGLTFKANTDDVRSSPALSILKLLKERKAKIKAYDPAGMNNAKSILPDIEYSNTIQEAAQNADCILILTEWEEFRNLDFDSLDLKNKLIVDLRNILDKGKLQSQGFRYVCIGIS